MFLWYNWYPNLLFQIERQEQTDSVRLIHEQNSIADWLQIYSKNLAKTMKGPGGNGFNNLHKVKSFSAGHRIYLYKEDQNI